MRVCVSETLDNFFSHKSKNIVQSYLCLSMLSYPRLEETTCFFFLFFFVFFLIKTYLSTLGLRWSLELNNMMTVDHCSTYLGCAPMTPGCLATRFDRFELCRFTFDLRQQRCVRVYVRNVCAIFDSPHQNLFSSRFDCEQSCAGGKLSY